MDATRIEPSHAPPPAAGDACLAVGKEFSSYGVLVNTISSHLERTGMPRSNLCIKSQGGLMSEEEATEYFGVPTHDGKRIYRRIQFYCNHSTTCPFRLPISFFKDKKVFRIVKHGGSDFKNVGTTDHCIAHDHPLEAMTTSLEDGTVLVKYEKDLKSEEVEAIKEKCLELIGMAKMQVRLREKFPMRSFDSALLHRMKKAHLDSVFGKDRHRLPQLFEKGEAIKAAGGVWHPMICTNTFRLEGTNYQESMMREYAKEYGQCCAFVDGTHGTNVYGIVTVPFTTVDCLGLSTIVGLTTMLNENSADIIRSGELFGLSGRPNESEVRCI